ncbi:MAG: hypothetical protein AB1521_10210 [Bacteroidota bacterium]
MNICLYLLPKELKSFLLVFVVVILIGTGVGLVYLGTTTSYTPKGTIERFNGSDVPGENPADDFEIPEQYAKPVSEMLITTHNHIFGLSLAYFAIGIIFYFNSMIRGFWKSFLMVEPLISVVVTFGSIWLIRYIDKNFIYLTIISSTLMFVTFYIMCGVIIIELIFKKEKPETIIV